MYKSDAMILIELGETSWRRQQLDEDNIDANLRVTLDLVHEIWEEAQVREEVANLKVARRYNTRVHEKTFHKGDLVWWKVGEAWKDKQEGKLAPNWDGLYRVVDFQNRAYKLEN